LDKVTQVNSLLIGLYNQHASVSASARDTTPTKKLKHICDAKYI